MHVALRIAMAWLLIAAPTLLYLGLLRGLQRLRDDALLMRIADSDDTPQDASATTAKALEKRPVRTDGRGTAAESPVAQPDFRERPPRPESVTCGTCGAQNMSGAMYCGKCLDELDR